MRELNCFLGINVNYTAESIGQSKEGREYL